MNQLYYFSEATMEDSFIYKTFNNSNDVLQKIILALRNGIVLEKSHIEEQYIQMKKSFISPLSREVIDAFENGDIELVFNKNEKVPISIPFVVRNKNGRTVATIFLSSFGSVNSSGDSLNIPTKNLYVLMESAYIALCIQTNPIKLMKNTTIQRLCNDIYTNMITRILNRDYALSLDKTTYSQITFSISKFFLRNIWGSTNDDIIKSYAMGVCVNPNPVDIEDINNRFNDAKIDDISDLIAFLKTITPRLNNLNVKFFMERYITTYNPPAILSVDYLPYLFFAIINTLLGAFLVSQNAMSDIVKNTKGINTFYQELSRLY